MHNVPDFSLEKNSGYKIVAGCDEAGRGPLCGPVVAASVVFLKHDFNDMPLITDSKQMSPLLRHKAYEWLTHNPDIVWSVGQCSVEEIDAINILQASLKAMQRAIDNLVVRADFYLIDGNKTPLGLNNSCAIIKGDSKSLSIAAASIIAKEVRDSIMKDLAVQFPQYLWNKNFGYPTKQHLQAIDRYGINEHYRKTYGPIKKRLYDDKTKNA